MGELGGTNIRAKELGVSTGVYIRRSPFVCTEKDYIISTEFMENGNNRNGSKSILRQKTDCLPPELHRV